MNTTKLRKLLGAALLLGVLGLTGCGGGGAGSSSTTTTSPSISKLSIGGSATSVKTDNSDADTITVSALDANNALLKGATINLSASSGQISSSSVTTDATTGLGTVTFSAGYVDKSNRTATITATATGAPSAQLPILVTGSTTSLTLNLSTLSAGNSTTATVTVKDAGGNAVSGAAVTLTPSSNAGDGTITLAPASGITNASGVFTANVTANTAGSLTLTASALGATGSATIQIVGAAAGVFSITSPATSPTAMSTGGTQAFTVNAPQQTSVRFSSTIGGWTECSGAAVCTRAVAGGTASATFTSSLAGVASIQVDGLNGTAVNATATHSMAITATTAATLALQSSAAVVAPSSGGSTNTTTLIATVRDAGNQPVGNVPVSFSILNPSGGGETISPVVAMSNASDPSTPLGQARATFTAGSLPSGAAGISVQATVVGTPAPTATTSIVIGGTAGSVVIGRANVISTSDSTSYTYPMSVMVTDSGGNPVSNATVTLSVWPTRYYTGTWGVSGSNCVSTYTNFTAGVPGAPNEDINQNLIMDPGEDVNGNGKLDPPSSSAGSVPATVTTDSNGVAAFNLVYLKTYAVWVDARVSASTLVSGTETTSNVVFNLPYLPTDISSTCAGALNSPFGP